MVGASKESWSENSPSIPEYIQRILGETYVGWFQGQEIDRAWRIAVTRKWSAYILGNIDRFFAFGQLQRVVTGKQPIGERDRNKWVKKESLLIQNCQPSRTADRSIRIYTMPDGDQST